MQSVFQLEENLRTYQKQLHHMGELHDADPSNAEYEEMVKELKEVIELTEEVLTSAKHSGSSSPKALSPSPEATQALAGPISEQASEPRDISERRLAVGSKVQAVWSEDGEWYNATVEFVTPIGYYVAYDDWGNKEEVKAANVREISPLEEGQEVIPSGEEEEENYGLDGAEREAEATKVALKRKIARAGELHVMPKDLPAKLKISPEDSEDMKLSKRKKIHAFKSKQRLERMELTQNKRQNAWQQFQGSKGKSKKVGFFTGRRKESIFKSPDDPKGKVGVTGSGKGITEFHKREKHLHLRVGGEDCEDW